ncbi:hypothetical protein Tco_1231702 [Tanacetum coccineum]
MTNNHSYKGNSGSKNRSKQGGYNQNSYSNNPNKGNGSSSRVFSNPNPPDFVVDPADFPAIGTVTNSRTGPSPNLVMAEQAVCCNKFTIEVVESKFEVSLKSKVEIEAFANGLEAGTYPKWKIDRVLANLEFQDCFVGAHAIFKPYRISYHSSSVLSIPSFVKVKPKPFKFFNVSILDKRFKDVVREGWSSHVSGFDMFRVVKKLKGLKKPIRKLMYDKGNLHANVIRLQENLDKLQTDLDNDSGNVSIREEEAAAGYKMVGPTMRYEPKAPKNDLKKIPPLSAASGSAHQNNTSNVDYVGKSSSDVQNMSQVNSPNSFSALAHEVDDEVVDNIYDESANILNPDDSRTTLSGVHKSSYTSTRLIMASIPIVPDDVPINLLRGGRRSSGKEDKDAAGNATIVGSMGDDTLQLLRGGDPDDGCDVPDDDEERDLLRDGPEYGNDGANNEDLKSDDDDDDDNSDDDDDEYVRNGNLNNPNITPNIL